MKLGTGAENNRTALFFFALEKGGGVDMKKMNSVILGGVGVVSAVIVVFTAKTSVATIAHLATVINTEVTNVADVVKTAIKYLSEKEE